MNPFVFASIIKDTLLYLEKDVEKVLEPRK
jgi:hypothetical protein